VVGSFGAYCTGILLVYAFGASFNWDIVAFYAIVLPIAAFIALCLVPESPAWLIRRKKIDKAKKALLWLRGGNTEQVEIYNFHFNSIEIFELNCETDNKMYTLKLF